MTRSTASFLVLCLFLWVLPLGNFIKPSQEKSACGGARAMHMCTMGMGKAHPKTADASKISFNNPSGLDKTPKSNSSAGGSDVLLNTQRLTAADKKITFIKSEDLPVYVCHLDKISPPPKLQVIF